MRSFILILGLIGLTACGDNAASTDNQDCRTDNVGCGAGLTCLLNAEGAFDCVSDTQTDASMIDASTFDAGLTDAVVADASVVDTGSVDANPLDADVMDANASDFTLTDAATPDAVVTDASVMDAATPVPTCEDGVANGNESDVDCGGECSACIDGKRCNAPTDCSSGVCQFNSCQVPRCGDAIINGAEICDDGNTITEDCAYGLESCTVCAADCTRQPGTIHVCGDNVIEANETCDDGNAETEACFYGDTQCLVCADDCTEQPGVTSTCGDNRVDAVFEECDANRTDSIDCPYGVQSCQLCSLNCFFVEGFARFCGDGNLDHQDGEHCDDANTNDTDGCTTNCLRARPKFCSGLCDPMGTVLTNEYATHRILREANPMSSNLFGYDVALNGDIAAVGSSQTEKTLDEPDWSGTISLFTRDQSDQWVPGQILTFPAGIIQDNFPSGFGEVIDMDGRVIVAGARYAYPFTGEGLALVFEPDANGVWSPQLLENPDRAANQAAFLMTDYGVSIAVDDNWVAVGAMGTAVNIINNADVAGAVYLFERSDGQWLFRQKVMAPDARANDYFGASVALDDGRLLVGATGMVNDNDPDNSFEAGKVYLFERQPNNQWSVTRHFEEPQMITQAYFGATVAINGDHAIMTAPGQFDDGARVWSTVLGSNGQWSELASMETPDPWDMVSRLGEALEIDGDTALVGAPGRPLEISGVHLYEWHQDQWIHRQVLRTDEEDTRRHHEFGHAVDMSEGRILIGAPGDSGPDPTALASFGAAFIFSDSPPICTEGGNCLCLPNRSGVSCSD